MTAVTPTDRPKSVRKSCVIKVFGGVVVLSRCFLDCSVGVGVFVTGLSQISSFFSYLHISSTRIQLCSIIALCHFKYFDVMCKLNLVTGFIDNIPKSCVHYLVERL